MELKSIFVAIVGRPNAGKSSLLNELVGEKVAIVTSKPQTTRTRITGVLTEGALQYVFLDTPGIHIPRTKLGERMAKTATDSVGEVDATMMLFEPYGVFNEAEMLLIEGIKAKKIPAIAVINKTDTLKKEADLEKRKQEIEAFGVFKTVVSMSVKNKENCADVLKLLEPYAKVGPHYFDDDDYTDLPEKALVAEMVREKILTFMRDEIPHGTAVVVEKFKERPHQYIIDIDINIYCEKSSHKGMIIGKGGAMLKKIASAARTDCEEFLGTRVNMQCWVKIKDDWRDNEFLLNNFGFKK